MGGIVDMKRIEGSRVNALWQWGSPPPCKFNIRSWIFIQKRYREGEGGRIHRNEEITRRVFNDARAERSNRVRVLELVLPSFSRCHCHRVSSAASDTRKTRAREYVISLDIADTALDKSFHCECIEFSVRCLDTTRKSEFQRITARGVGLFCDSLSNLKVVSTWASIGISFGNISCRFLKRLLV